MPNGNALTLSAPPGNPYLHTATTLILGKSLEGRYISNLLGLSWEKARRQTCTGHGDRQSLQGPLERLCTSADSSIHLFTRNQPLLHCHIHSSSSKHGSSFQNVNLVAPAIPHSSWSFSVLAFKACIESAPGHMESKKTRFLVLPNWHTSIMLNYYIPESTYATQREYKA